MLPEQLDAVCDACGGYGVTVYGRSDGRTKAKCGGCAGAGHFMKSPPEPWATWTPDPATLALLDAIPEHVGDAW